MERANLLSRQQLDEAWQKRWICMIKTFMFAHYARKCGKLLLLLTVGSWCAYILVHLITNWVSGPCQNVILLAKRHIILENPCWAPFKLAWIGLPHTLFCKFELNLNKWELFKPMSHCLYMWKYFLVGTVLKDAMPLIKNVMGGESFHFAKHSVLINISDD